MDEKKPYYSDLVIQVVRESPEPLPFPEIMERVNTLFPITTRNPKSTIRNAISQTHLVASTGDGRYGWKYRLINGAALRLPLSEKDLSQHRVILTDEVRDALWPAFFEGEKRGDREPVHLALPDGSTTACSLVSYHDGGWGTGENPELWDFIATTGAKPGDELIIRVVDGEAREYALEFQPREVRDEAAIAARNQEILAAANREILHSWGGLAIWEVSSRLLCTGQYRHPIPPDPLEVLLKDSLSAPGLPFLSDFQGWMLSKGPVIDPLIESLLAQIEEAPRRRPVRNGAAQPAAASRIYQIKASLTGIRPPIWRRIQVPGDLTLPQLHAVLQIAMGWTNSHLHGFRVGGKFFSVPDPGPFDMGVVDERRFRLEQIAPEVGARFIYEYDFGDSWEHTIFVEKILPAEPGAVFPRCMDGKRACPPEDVGSVGGYDEFLDAIQDPGHPEHDEWLEWIGGSFDAEAFDLQGTNELLHTFYAQLTGSE